MEAYKALRLGNYGTRSDEERRSLTDGVKGAAVYCAEQADIEVSGCRIMTDLSQRPWLVRHATPTTSVEDDSKVRFSLNIKISAQVVKELDTAIASHPAGGQYKFDLRPQPKTLLRHDVVTLVFYGEPDDALVQRLKAIASLHGRGPADSAYWDDHLIGVPIVPGLRRLEFSQIEAVCIRDLLYTCSIQHPHLHNELKKCFLGDEGELTAASPGQFFALKEVLKSSGVALEYDPARQRLSISTAAEPHHLVECGRSRFENLDAAAVHATSIVGHVVTAADLQTLYGASLLLRPAQDAALVQELLTALQHSSEEHELQGLYTLRDTTLYRALQARESQELSVTERSLFEVVGLFGPIFMIEWQPNEVDNPSKRIDQSFFMWIGGRRPDGTAEPYTESEVYKAFLHSLAVFVAAKEHQLVQGKLSGDRALFLDLQAALLACEYPFKAVEVASDPLVATAIRRAEEMYSDTKTMSPLELLRYLSSRRREKGGQTHGTHDFAEKLFLRMIRDQS